MREDRMAMEREDHILDCYEHIKEQDAEIGRLQNHVASAEGTMQEMIEVSKKADAEIERLRAALQEIVEAYDEGWDSTPPPDGRMADMARKALDEPLGEMEKP